MQPSGNILALDTTMAACSVALELTSAGGGARRYSRFEEMATGHAEALMPMIAGVLEEAGCTAADLQAIAVTIGPGTFTGTRLGVAAARGLALATGLPVYTATSLAIIARAGLEVLSRSSGAMSPETEIDVCVDARREQVYRQRFAGDGLAALSGPVVTSVGDLAAEIAGCPSRRILVGSGAPSVARAVAQRGGLCDVGAAMLLPDAALLLSVPLERASPPRPLYLRPPDAKPQAGKAIPRQHREHEGRQ